MGSLNTSTYGTGGTGTFAGQDSTIYDGMNPAREEHSSSGATGGGAFGGTTNQRNGSSRGRWEC